MMGKDATLVLVAGLPGTGKTSFATALARTIGALHFNSDKVRSEMGLRGRYTREIKKKVYARLLEKAENALLQERDVVVDATFYKKELRKPWIDLAVKTGANLRWVQIRAKEETVRRRLKKKRKWSEADFEVYGKIKSRFEPINDPVIELWSDDHSPEELAGLGLDFIKASSE